MEQTTSTIDFDNLPDTFETAQPSKLESFLAVARAAHEERIRAFWLRFGVDYDDVKP
jgi:hypothetical protein